MTKYDPRKNAEGYNDPTPYAAEKHMMAQIRGKQARVAGGYFENIISASCDYYLSRGLAKIEKTPEPMKPLGAKNRKGQFLACYIKTRNPAVFPKKERLGLAQRMMNEASDLVADLMEANDLLLTDPEERELRYRAQRSALRNCRKLIHHIELAHEILSGFSDDAFAYWAKMAAGVKNQTAKWYKTDKERATKLDAQKRHQ